MLRVVPYTLDLEPAVARWNERFEAAGQERGFPESHVPARYPQHLNPRLYYEYLVAIDGGGDVRGGYFLRHQDFFLDGEIRSLGNYARPLSEGVTDRRFGLVGVSLLADAMKRQPLLFGLGIGGTERPTARLMKGARWEFAPIPFWFRPVRPARVLRMLRAVRGSRARRLLLDAAAGSGLGPLAVHADRLLRTRIPRQARASEVERVDTWGPWVDALWTRAHGAYFCVAVRDQASLDLLYPSSEARFHRLRIRAGEEDLGWVVCLATRFHEDRYFGNLMVGTIVDALASPEHAGAVLYHADRQLERLGVDLIVSNQAHVAWGRGLQNLAYRRGPTNFYFAAAPPLRALLGPLPAAIPRMHLNRGDGDGPLHL